MQVQAPSVTRLLALSFVLLLLPSCVSYPRILSQWPDDLPPADLFIQAYENDPDNQEVQSIEDYLIWAKRFYRGWIVYENGWLHMSKDLVEHMPEEDRGRAAQRIAYLGREIAPEWAKEKPDRYIYTNMVAVWGESLLEALSRDQVFEYMDAVDRDIALLKTGELERGEIQIERYFPEIEQEDFVF